MSCLTRVFQLRSRAAAAPADCEETSPPGVWHADLQDDSWVKASGKAERKGQKWINKSVSVCPGLWTLEESRGSRLEPDQWCVQVTCPDLDFSCFAWCLCNTLWTSPSARFNLEEEEEERWKPEVYRKRSYCNTQKCLCLSWRNIIELFTSKQRGLKWCVISNVFE